MASADADQGSLEALREHNRLRVVDALRRSGTATRGELACLTGLSRTTVATLVADLRARGQAGELAPGDRRSTRLNSSHPVISHAGFCLKNQSGGCDGSDTVH